MAFPWGSSPKMLISLKGQTQWIKAIGVVRMRRKHGTLLKTTGRSISFLGTTFQDFPLDCPRDHVVFNIFHIGCPCTLSHTPRLHQLVSKRHETLGCNTLPVYNKASWNETKANNAYMFIYNYIYTHIQYQSIFESFCSWFLHHGEPGKWQGSQRLVKAVWEVTVRYGESPFLMGIYQL